MRAIWSGNVSFGLVSVPVKLYAARQSHDVTLHQVHDKDGGRIHYERHCEVCNEKVDYDDIDRAYDDGDDTVIITDEELKSLPAEASHEIDVVQFVPNDQVDVLLLDKAYYLEPASKSEKAYVLLRETLADTNRTAIVTFTLRSRTRLGALRVRGDVIVLQTLLWADEVRKAEFDGDRKVTINDKERKMAHALVDEFSEDFEPEKFVDTYQQELGHLIEDKVEHGDAIDSEASHGDSGEEEGSGNVVDLMEALKRSVDAQRGAKGTADAKKSGAKKTGPTKKTGPKKNGSKDSSAKKTSTKNSSGGKTSGRKSSSSQQAEKKKA